MRTPFKYISRLGPVFAIAGIVAGIFVSPTIARADMKAGIAAYRAGDYKTALAEFSALAEAGDPNAQFSLAVLYLSGRGVERDVVKALDLHRKAADQGLVAAEHGLGVFYYQGMGVKQDYAEALKWFGRAAAKGFAESEFNLGVMYFNSEGVRRDEIEVVKWISLAAARKFAPAQYRLGRMYEAGVIFATNPDAALHWYRQAEANGSRQAAAARARLVKSLGAAAAPQTLASQSPTPQPPPIKPSPETQSPKARAASPSSETPGNTAAKTATASEPVKEQTAPDPSTAPKGDTIAEAAPVPAPPSPVPAPPSKPSPPPVDGWKNPFSLSPVPEAPAPASTSVAGRPSDPPSESRSDSPSMDGQPPAAAPVKGPEWRIQFAAYRSAAEAERALASLNERAGAAIGRTPRIIDIADMGARGVFHRIQAGPLDSAEAANKLCVIVKAVLPDQACVPLEVGNR